MTCARKRSAREGRKRGKKTDLVVLLDLLHTVANGKAKEDVGTEGVDVHIAAEETRLALVE
jgi:hypothetical protein